MISDPIIITRAAEPYVALPATLTLADIDAAAPDLFGRVFDWAAARGLAVGAPFLKHTVIDMDGLLALEFGVPLTAPAALPDGDGVVVAGTLPAGRYGLVTQRGPYGGADGELYRANARLVGWGAATGRRWDSWPTARGEAFACRLEVYRVGPHAEPDPTLWHTDVLIKLATA